MTRNGRPAGATVAAGVAVVALGVWAGAHFHSAHERDRVHVAAGEASPPSTGDFAADFDPATAPAKTIPERLPAFTLADLNGKPTSVTTWGGKSLVLNFWATWCAPCRREIPLLKTLSGEWSGRDVEVVGVAVDFRDKVAAYAASLNIPYPILIGEEDALDVAAKFGVESPVFPFTVFTDRRGDVVTLFVGELHKPQVDLILSVVQNVNDRKLDLTEARRNIAQGLEALKSDPRHG